MNSKRLAVYDSGLSVSFICVPSPDSLALDFHVDHRRLARKIGTVSQAVVTCNRKQGVDEQSHPALRLEEECGPHLPAAGSLIFGEFHSSFTTVDCVPEPSGPLSPKSIRESDIVAESRSR